MADSTATRSWEDGFADDFLAQPAQISIDERDEIDSGTELVNDRLVRRLALQSLTRSGAELVEAVSGSREIAVGTAQVSNQIARYATRLHSPADMMQSASVRLLIALCAREDMEGVLEEAKALDDSAEVGHA